MSSARPIELVGGRGAWPCGFCGGLCDLVKHRDGSAFAVMHSTPACKQFREMPAADFARSSHGARATHAMKEAFRLVGSAFLLMLPIVCLLVRLTDPPTSRLQFWAETGALVALCLVMMNQVRAVERSLTRVGDRRT